MAYNGHAAPTATFDLASAGTFDLTSFVIAGAWGSQTLGIEGLLNGAVSFALDLGVTTAAQLVNLNWSGIDALRINIDPTDTREHLESLAAASIGQSITFVSTKTLRYLSRRFGA